MIVLDASVLIGHLHPFDAHHDHATRILLDADPPALVHAITLAEVLVGGVRVGRAAEMRADLHSAGVQLADRDDDEPLRLAGLRVATGLTLPDCCVLDTALVRGAGLATFDATLAAVARRSGVLVLP